MNQLEVKNLTVKFGGLTAVSDLSFNVEKGSIHGLIGANGAGKSTVINCISRFYKPDSGSIFLEDQDVLQLKTDQVITQGIARTFQNLEMFKSVTAFDNVIIGYHSKIDYSALFGGFLPGSVKRKEKEIKEKVMDIMGIFNIEQYAGTKVKHLPYGILKKIEIARALITEPKLLLLDEPAAGLNMSETEELAETFRYIKKRFNLTMILVEHDMNFVMSMCNRITVLDFGVKIGEGSPEEVSSNPAVIEAYLGKEAENA